MTSSENLASMEPWTCRLPFADSWIENFARDTETLTKALQRSLSSAAAPPPPPQADPFSFNSGGGGLFESRTSTASGVSGSDPESAAPKRRAPAASGAKIAKRKSRASKRTQTTFITADPENFRQMVQQVTGVRFGNLQLPVPPVVKPEPHRAGNGFRGCLPTLDTSAFLLDQQQQHQHQQPPPFAGPPAPVASHQHQEELSLAFPPPADGVAAFDFDGYVGFPTLESWKVM